MNMLTDGVDWLSNQLEEHASTEMIYRRGSSSVEVPLTQGKSEYTTYDDEGNLVTKVTDATFICPACRLMLGGKVVEPVAGDRIETKRGTKTLVYEVVPRGNLQPFSLDSTGTMLRIHTKLIQSF